MTLAGKEESAHFGPDRTDSDCGPAAPPSSKRGQLTGALYLELLSVEVRGCHFWALISMGKFITGLHTVESTA